MMNILNIFGIGSAGQKNVATEPGAIGISSSSQRQSLFLPMLLQFFAGNSNAHETSAFATPAPDGTAMSPRDGRMEDKTPVNRPAGNAGSLNSGSAVLTYGTASMGSVFVALRNMQVAGGAMNKSMNSPAESEIDLIEKAVGQLPATQLQDNKSSEVVETSDYSNSQEMSSGQSDSGNVSSLAAATTQGEMSSAPLELSSRTPHQENRASVSNGSVRLEGFELVSNGASLTVDEKVEPVVGEMPDRISNSEAQMGKSSNAFSQQYTTIPDSGADADLAVAGQQVAQPAGEHDNAAQGDVRTNPATTSKPSALPSSMLQEMMTDNEGAIFVSSPEVRSGNPKPIALPRRSEPSVEMDETEPGTGETLGKVNGDQSIEAMLAAKISIPSPTPVTNDAATEISSAAASVQSPPKMNSASQSDEAKSPVVVRVVDVQSTAGGLSAQGARTGTTILPTVPDATSIFAVKENASIAGETVGPTPDPHSSAPETALFARTRVIMDLGAAQSGDKVL